LDKGLTTHGGLFMQFTELPYPFGRALAEEGVKEYFCWDFVPNTGILVYGFDLSLVATLTKTNTAKAFLSSKEPAENSNSTSFNAELDPID